MIGGLTADPKMAQDILGWIRKALETAPTPMIVADFIRHVGQAQALTSQYTMSLGIQSFFLKVKENKACIDDLTPEVLEWLRQNKLTKKLKITS